MTPEIAIGRVLGEEGGYVNRDPKDDPGGETNWGISKRSYPDVDIKNLTKDQAIEMYRRDFWARIHADELPAVLVYPALDFAVNSGVETAIRKLQVAAGVADDGHWGPVTRAAVKAMDPNDLALRYVAERIDYMRKLKNFLANASGWMARIANVLRFAAQDN